MGANSSIRKFHIKRFLLTMGAICGDDPSKILKLHWSACLATQAAEGNLMRVREYLKSAQALQLDVNAPDHQGRLPLHCAVFAGKAEIVEELLKAGANPNKLEIKRSGRADFGGLTKSCALSLAAYQGFINIAQILLAKGANVNPRNAGPTPLYNAALRGDVQMIRWLVKNKADLNMKSQPATGNEAQTPLQAAKQSHCYQAVHEIQNSTTSSKRRSGAAVVGEEMTFQHQDDLCLSGCLSWLSKVVIWVQEKKYPPVRDSALKKTQTRSAPASESRSAYQAQHWHAHSRW